jgi:dolichyl-phosphate-mannose-protein mannosyltransferase
VTPPIAERFARGAGAPLVAALLLSLYAYLAITGVREKSIVFDELAHITAGTAAWTTGDYRLFPQNGQLPQRWAALPLVASFRFPTREQSAWWTSDLEAIGSQFLYGSGNAHDSLLWRARLMMMPVAVALGGLCFVWARRLFGGTGALVTVFIFTFSPSMLAHGPVATSDLFAALMFTAALGTLWSSLHRPDFGRVSASALVMGLLFVTKMSAFVMVPVAIVLAAIRVWRKRPLVWPGRWIVTRRSELARLSVGILLAHAVGVIIVIWASYGFRYATFHDAVSGRDRMFLGETIDSLASRTAARPAIVLARDLHLLPEPYLFGVAHVLNRSGRHIGFLNGQYSVNGWWYFFPYCWLVKTPLPVMALLALALVAQRRRWAGTARTARYRERVLYSLVPLIVFPTIYWLVAMASPLNLGERHLLPAYPSMFILAGGAAKWAKSRDRRFGLAAVAAMLAVLGAESMAIRPHYLAYFNVLAGGPESGYRHLVDSSLDWGQDLPGLKRWLDAHDFTSSAPAYLSYFGSGDPAAYGIRARQIYSYQDWRTAPPLYPLTGGIYCVSATMLQSLYTRAPGPWAAPYERAYQMTRAEFERQPPNGPGGRAVQIPDGETTAWQRRQNEFDQLRTSRLFAFLRQRHPDDQIGYSILIFRLSDDEVERALHGPPAEMWPDIGVEGASFGPLTAPVR